jgi:hypothetical protein
MPAWGGIDLCPKRRLRKVGWKMGSSTSALVALFFCDGGGVAVFLVKLETVIIPVDATTRLRRWSLLMLLSSTPHKPHLT